MNLTLLNLLSAVKQNKNSIYTLSHTLQLPILHCQELVHFLCQQQILIIVNHTYQLSPKGLVLLEYLTQHFDSSNTANSILIILDTYLNSSHLSTLLTQLKKLPCPHITLLSFDPKTKLQFPHLNVIIKPNLLSSFHTLIQEQLMSMPQPTLLLNGHSTYSDQTLLSLFTLPDTILLNSQKLNKPLTSMIIPALTLSTIPKAVQPNTHRFSDYLIALSQKEAISYTFSSAISKNKTPILEFEKIIEQFNQLLQSKSVK